MEERARLDVGVGGVAHLRTCRQQHRRDGAIEVPEELGASRCAGLEAESPERLDTRGVAGEHRGGEGTARLVRALALLGPLDDRGDEGGRSGVGAQQELDVAGLREEGVRGEASVVEPDARVVGERLAGARAVLVPDDIAGVRVALAGCARHDTGTRESDDRLEIARLVGAGAGAGVLVMWENVATSGRPAWFPITTARR